MSLHAGAHARYPYPFTGYYSYDPLARDNYDFHRGADTVFLSRTARRPHRGRRRLFESYYSDSATYGRIPYERFQDPYDPSSPSFYDAEYYGYP
ncbi:MAG: hypothetical protein DWQ37_11340 [Planctomycetota bacterium]|nr:MAG: hypothetical protein DWQ37_11340 [Planctomycetota bacterium]